MVCFILSFQRGKFCYLVCAGFALVKNGLHLHKLSMLDPKASALVALLQDHGAVVHVVILAERVSVYRASQSGLSCESVVNGRDLYLIEFA
jgi:hypothetical protein